MNCWDSKFTWQTGVMYQFDNGLSPYASYATAFAPNQQTESEAAHSTTPPARSTNSASSTNPKAGTPPLPHRCSTCAKGRCALDAAVVTTSDRRQPRQGVELELNSDLSEHGDVTLVDAKVGYAIDDNWSVEVNARNLFDKEYVAGCNNAGRCYWVKSAPCSAPFRCAGNPCRENKTPAICMTGGIGSRRKGRDQDTAKITAAEGLSIGPQPPMILEMETEGWNR